MEAANTSVPTRVKKYNYSWYTVAAVATAMQISFDHDVEAKAVGKIRCVDFKDLSTSSSIPTTSTTIAFAGKIFESSGNTIVSPSGTQYQDDISDVAIKPRYVKEFKIRVPKLKIDKSVPKIFVD